MAFIQVRRWSGRAAVEAVQDERTSGVGAFKTAGARTADGCGGADSNNKVAEAVGAAGEHSHGGLRPPTFGA